VLSGFFDKVDTQEQRSSGSGGSAKEPIDFLVVHLDSYLNGDRLAVHRGRREPPLSYRFYGLFIAFCAKRLQNAEVTRKAILVDNQTKSYLPPLNLLVSRFLAESRHRRFKHTGWHVRTG